jgi:hypothetical protein
VHHSVGGFGIGEGLAGELALAEVECPGADLGVIRSDCGDKGGDGESADEEKLFHGGTFQRLRLGLGRLIIA